MTQSALVFVNGQCSDAVLRRLVISESSLLLAVDGGLRHVLALDRVPHWLIGDLDSVDPAQLALVSRGPTRVVRHPIEKDATDLELALQHVSELGVDAVTLVAITGGRLDQTLANLLLLGRPEWPFSIEIQVDEGAGQIISANRPLRRHLPLSSSFSLLPLTEQVCGVTTRGLYYPLANASLPLGSTRGISNSVTGHAVEVIATHGSLLALYQPDSPINSDPQDHHVDRSQK